MVTRSERTPLSNSARSHPAGPSRLSRLAVDFGLCPSHDQIAAILGTEILRGGSIRGDNMSRRPALIACFQVSGTVMRASHEDAVGEGLVAPKHASATRVRIHCMEFLRCRRLVWRVGSAWPTSSCAA